MSERLSVTVVGPGNLGTALAKALHAAGIKVDEIVYRNRASKKRATVLAKAVGASAIEFEDWRTLAPPAREGSHGSKVVWICVGDSEIASTAASLPGRRNWNSHVVFHSSGALTSDELRSLRRRGAQVASVHPMMTFVRSAAPSMSGTAFAIEGDQPATVMARRVVKQLGGQSFEIGKKDKPLYHALGAFVSPLIIAQLAAAERIGREVGLQPRQTRNIVAPILMQTVRNYVQHGPAAAFSGPIVRGDADTVRKNLTALKRVRGAGEIYRALARVAVEELPSRNAKAIKKAI